MPISITFSVIKNPIRNPNTEQGNTSIKNIVSDNPKHVPIIIAGANIIATIIDINTVNPKIILIAFISLNLKCKFNNRQGC